MSPVATSAPLTCPNYTRRLFPPPSEPRPTGRRAVTLTLDAMRSARHVIISAAKPSQATMVRKALGWSNAHENTKVPAGMVAAAQ